MHWVPHARFAGRIRIRVKPRALKACIKSGDTRLHEEQMRPTPASTMADRSLLCPQLAPFFHNAAHLSICAVMYRATYFGQSPGRTSKSLHIQLSPALPFAASSATLLSALNSNRCGLSPGESFTFAPSPESSCTFSCFFRLSFCLRRNHHMVASIKATPIAVAPAAIPPVPAGERPACGGSCIA